MTSYDNAAPLDGWVMPTRCCGEWQTSHDCGVCGNTMPTELRIAPNIVLGSE